MLEPLRHPTQEEIEAIVARARQMRAQYVGTLITRGMLRVTQVLTRARPRRGIGARRLRTDMG